MFNISFVISKLFQNVRYKFSRETCTGNSVRDFTRRIVLLTIAQLKDSFTNREYDLKNNLLEKFNRINWNHLVVRSICRLMPNPSMFSIVF